MFMQTRERWSEEERMGMESVIRGTLAGADYCVSSAEFTTSLELNS